MNLAGLILKAWGWQVDITVPDFDKCIICVAPHTSNWDFILGKLAYASINRKAGFLMKETWFFPPMGWIFKAMGGIPVPRKRGAALTAAIVKRFDRAKRLHLAVTPEGTRTRVDRWRTGFLHIALDANVPLVLGVLDFGRKHITVSTVFKPTGDIDADLQAIKDFYAASGASGKFKDRFSTAPQPPKQ